MPVAILLPPATSRHPRGEPGRPGRVSDHTACQLIARYTHHGELVIDLDANPAIAAAAGWLERHSLTLTDRDLAPADPHQRESSPPPGTDPARLVIATLPRPGASSLGGISEWMRQVSGRLLAPGGFLLTVVTGAGAGRYTDHATTIITAAAAAGLSWHQHIIDVYVALPEHEPRAEPGTAAATAPRLVRGRHRRAHNDLFAFTNAGGEDPDA
ncbi:MAG: hypothetical protein GEV12_12185 [Micromonosporaceae bacterium]|nr:hypothetical protein [Micromonosporaceae bacterium]